MTSGGDSASRDLLLDRDQNLDQEPRQDQRGRRTDGPASAPPQAEPDYPEPDGTMGEAETRVIYHLEDQDTPYLIRINVPAQRVTLADFKRVLNKPNLKFFFKSVDDDFG